MLALHIVGTGGLREQGRGPCFSGIRVTVLTTVVDDHFQAISELLEPVDDLGKVEVIGDHPHLRARLRDGLVQDFEDRAARLEAHPLQRLVGLGVGRLEAQPIFRERRKDLADGSKLLISIDKRLRRHEAARERHIQCGISLARELNRSPLRVAVAQFVSRIHENRGHPIGKITGEFGVGRKVHPTKLLNG